MNRHFAFVRWVLWFLLFNILCSQTVALFYFYRTGLYPQTLAAWIYTFFYWNGHFATLAFAVLVLLALILLATPFYKIHRVSLPILTSLLLIFLFIDTFVYAQYKFHINHFVIDLFVHGQGQIISFPWHVWFYVLTLVVGVFILEFYVAGVIWKTLPRISARRQGWKWALFYFLCILSMHTMHIVADGMYYQPITRMDALFPLSYPAYAQDFLVKYNLVNVEEYKKRSVFKAGNISSDEKTLRYPVKPLHCQEPQEKLNILWILVDALRADMLTPEIMPQAYALSQQSQVFTHHMSNGNSTRYGIFSLFYGIPGSYFEVARSSRTSPLFMDQLQKENYELGIFASAPLTKPEFDQTVFSKVPHLRTMSQGNTEYERDREITEEWKKFVTARDERKPFFGFLFYDSTHGYAFPPQMDLPFKPSWDQVDYMALHDGFDPTPFLNRYKNSVYFVDSLIGEVIAQLKEKNLDKNTVILISSDHGQEFNDNKLNYWGHNSNFSPAQTHVPFVLYWPGLAPAHFDELTSHYDLSTTFLQKAFGCSNPAPEMTSGQNLFAHSPHDWVLMASYDTYAIYTEKNIVAVNAAGNYEIVDQHYQPQSHVKLDTPMLTKALKEMGRFYR